MGTGGRSILCTEDRAIAPQLQRMMGDALPFQEVLCMTTDHSPFYSAPEALARHLIALAGRLQGQDSVAELANASVG